MINKILIGCVVVLALASWFMFDQLIKTKAELATTSEGLKSLQSAVTLVQKEQAEYAKTAQAITSRFRKQERDLEGLKNREKVVLAKKSLVQLKINKAFTADQLELACKSGDISACE